MNAYKILCILEEMKVPKTLFVLTNCQNSCTPGGDELPQLGRKPTRLVHLCCPQKNRHTKHQEMSHV